MFHCYKKDNRTIQATELAYETIYKAQGFLPVDAVKATSEPVKDSEAGDTNGTAGSNTDDSGKAKTIKRSRKSE